MDDIDLEKTAADETVIEASETRVPTKKPKVKLSIRFKEMMKNPKKRKIFIASVIVVLLLALFGFGFYSLRHESELAKQDSAKTDENSEDSSVKVQAPLDGMMTSQAAANRHPLAIVVENHPDARPQAGLDRASIVYETIAEGGITRFLAIFGTAEADKVGPVRSARTYFVDWAHGYDAYLGHVGGNIDALDKIKTDKILDLDQFAYSDPYWRVGNGNVATEHTMFTSTSRLRDQANKNNYSKANNFNVFKFKDDPTEEQKAALPKSQNVTIDFSNATYQVKYSYDPATNNYKRVLNGTPHIDQLSKNQLAAKNIIVMTVDRKATVTRINESGYDMTTIGSGKAKIFFDGQMITGTWRKASKTDRELFYDASGNEITFNRGQFWIEVVDSATAVTVE